MAPPALTIHPHGVLYEPARYPDVKDPCLVEHQGRWHVFGTGCGSPQGLEILHLTAPTLDGPWEELTPPELDGVDHIEHPAAPGVASDGRQLHLFLQHDFNVLGGNIEHLVSVDGGASFRHADIALESIEGSDEAGVYDPDPATVRGQQYLTYAAMSTIGRPDIYLARSRSGGWDGPWERLGCILRHDDVPFHNQLGDVDYEWGLEGPQLLELPTGEVLLTGVCFLRDRPPGARQRVLLALADDPCGPYRILDPPLPPDTPDGDGENGHGTAAQVGRNVRLVYQERSGRSAPWRFRHASLTVDAPPRRRAGARR
jgi:hypothetical protein